MNITGSNYVYKRLEVRKTFYKQNIKYQTWFNDLKLDWFFFYIAQDTLPEANFYFILPTT